MNRVKRSGHISLGSKSQMVFLLWKVFFESLTVTGIAINIEGFILIDAWIKNVIITLHGLIHSTCI